MSENKVSMIKHQIVFPQLSGAVVLSHCIGPSKLSGAVVLSHHGGALSSSAGQWCLSTTDNFRAPNYPSINGQQFPTADPLSNFAYISPPCSLF